ncbi:MAG: hypothetical protein HC845_08720 [Akkermansiaceae bacterium]|nr:hypothetical protein [Akkermansiaceae bacterium]
MIQFIDPRVPLLRHHHFLVARLICGAAILACFHGHVSVADFFGAARLPLFCSHCDLADDAPVSLDRWIFWDAHCALATHSADPEIYAQPVESLRFGYSILLFGAMGYLMQGIQPLFKQGKWHFSAILSGIAIFLYLTAEYAIITFIRGDASLPKPRSAK